MASRRDRSPSPGEGEMSKVSASPEALNPTSRTPWSFGQASGVAPQVSPFSAVAPSAEAQRRPRFNTSQPHQQEAQTSSRNADHPPAPKKKKHKGGKKRRNRRQSFAAPAVEVGPDEESHSPHLDGPMTASGSRDTFYLIPGGPKSNTSLESEALLDHRQQVPMQARRQSAVGQAAAHSTQSLGLPSTRRQSTSTPHRASNLTRSRLSRVIRASYSEEDEEAVGADDGTPLLGTSIKNRGATTPRGISYAGNGSSNLPIERERSSDSLASARRKALGSRHSQDRADGRDGSYDINNPPSVPPSPILSPDFRYDDVMLHGSDIEGDATPPSLNGARDVVLDVDESSIRNRYGHSTSPPQDSGLKRRMTNAAEDDVCFPQEDMSIDEAASKHERDRDQSSVRGRRRRRRVWPDLAVLEAWALEEKEERTMEGIRARKISEPLLVGGRLRPRKITWHREEEEAPYRFTYFNEDFHSTIHSQTLSELPQEGQTFRDLLIPDPPLLSDDSSDEGDDTHHDENTTHRSPSPLVGSFPKQPTEQQVSYFPRRHRLSDANHETGRSSLHHLDHHNGKPKKYGSRPIYWLDVLCPTDSEMKILSKTFGIHPLTTEDIITEENREKVELFSNYYFVNYRSFEQDPTSEDYLEPLNVYVVVFRECVLSFHHSQTPHPANVRRRIRQLSDYLVLSTDWISYALIDDITDCYAPLIESIEDEVDAIDSAILGLHSTQEKGDPEKRGSYIESDKLSIITSATTVMNASDMLRRIGKCRKKVITFLRLLGYKADVIKGFAKRCNETSEVAPRSEIGLYLGDIQDHIVTMVGALTYHENLLSRVHSNYLAQINIRQTEKGEQTNSMLSKLTVLGTIVLPMNIVTGMFGSNFPVPGQESDGLTWFYSVSVALLLFGLLCFFIAKRTFGIV
ncbi:cora-domain-containing protein [Trichodelitschia bisporula]|uniref:Cora-domain-containing protein n=1 Tax=Trichodelitschia bisporula TaxID=703511 RepID=A0A6G1I2P8_9PEZI|nr:cora-domain-containing protein [Trichodelitschia bisporula]